MLWGYEIATSLFGTMSSRKDLIMYNDAFLNAHMEPEISTAPALSVPGYLTHREKKTTGIRKISTPGQDGTSP